MEDKLTYKDVKEYEALFTLAPSMLLSSFARRNSNLVSKFRGPVEQYLGNLNETQKHQLELILSADTDELQAIMRESYQKTKKRQFKILANPKNKGFIEINLNEIRKIINS